jgi:hypothetical protein
MATTAGAPASVAPSLAPKANDSRKAVVPVDASELEKHVLAVDDKFVDRAAIAGYELLKRVKESAALRGIYVVIMSSMTIVIYIFSNKILR